MRDWTRIQRIPVWADICPSRIESENRNWVLREEAEARIAELEAALRMAGQLALDERWNERFPKVFSTMEAALGGDDG